MICGTASVEPQPGLMKLKVRTLSSGGVPAPPGSPSPGVVQPDPAAGGRRRTTLSITPRVGGSRPVPHGTSSQLLSKGR